jgi:citrate lyase gamma subunit
MNEDRNLPAIRQEADIMAQNLLRSLGERILDAVHATEYKHEADTLRLEVNRLRLDNGALEAAVQALKKTDEDRTIEINLLSEVKEQLEKEVERCHRGLEYSQIEQRKLQHRLDTIRGVAEGLQDRAA